MEEKKQDIFEKNEYDANRYTAFCLRIAAIVAVLMWLLNILGFFIIDDRLMNIAMPIGVVLFLLPSLLVKSWKFDYRLLKYVTMGCFLMGVCIMATALTLQLILAWACPIVLSCHYYSPKFTRYTIVGVLLLMLISVYSGLLLGVWDSNMMRSNDAIYEVGARIEFMRTAAANGDNILLRVFNFYYLPRAVVLIIVHLFGLTLSSRTHKLLATQEEITRERERIGAELSVATDIQASMLPSIFPAFPDRTEFDIYASMYPAKEVGGDFYDFFLIDHDHMALVIADVSGKGVPAALFMVIAKTLIKNAVQAGMSPKGALEQVNGQLCDNNDAEMFVTAWVGIYEISTGKLVAANAGHEYPIIKSGGGEFRVLHDKHGFVLAGMEASRYTEYELLLEVGDTVFLYTDGVTEAGDLEDRPYGMERLVSALNENLQADPRAILGHVSSSIEAFTGDAPQFDDITMLCIKRRK